MDIAQITVEFAAPLVGVFVGTLLALWLDRRNTSLRKMQRAESLLVSLQTEITENHHIIQRMRPAYDRERWGKSFYLNMNAWETAMAAGDLADTIGIELASRLSTHYGRFQRIAYYVDLMTKLWFAPDTIEGQDNIRQGFHENITKTMREAMNQHQIVMGAIEKQLRQAKRQNRR